MKRFLSNYLTTWLKSNDRKPLILRGARQVGKTWLVRELAKTSKKQLLELNFEKQPTTSSLFHSNDTQQILLNLSTLTNYSIDPTNSILFLDEIQAIPQMLSKLRWFAEDMPQLPVIAAGSLLEFVLAEHTFSMPVGRVTYAHVEPLSFEEFLLANDLHSFYEYINKFDFSIEIPTAIHEKLTQLFREYILIGGLPGVVSNWINNHSINQANQIQHDLLATYRDDFAKYRGRIATDRLEEVMLSIPKMLGEKIVYSRINPQVQSTTIKQVLDLLEKARLCHRVQSSAANGIPLGAEVKKKYFKEIFLDVGLCSTSLGLHLNQINSLKDLTMIHHGGIAEQVVGQQLRTIFPPYIEPNLYYWNRDESGSNAEIDYVIQHENRVVPIEVKAGSTGSLKSLHLFMGLKKLSLAMRINSDYPSKVSVAMKDSQSNPVQYTLLSIPFYLAGQIQRLLSLSN